MQILTQAPGYGEVDPRKKNEEWANGQIKQHRLNWTPIVDPATAAANEDMLFGRQDNSMVIAMFSDPKGANLDFTPEKPLEKVRNIIVGENENEDIQLEVNAVDPSSLMQRKADMELLSNRSDTEEFLSYLGASINMPSFKIEVEKFNGNVSEFDSQGLDEGSTEDVSHFFDNRYKLRHEAALENAIAAYLRANEAKKKLPNMCNDIMANKSTAVQVFVDEMSGNININYLKPSNVYVVKGNRSDFKDAACIGYEEDVTLMQFMRRLGSSFNLERDWREILRAVNARNNTKYAAIGDSMTSPLYGQCNKVEHLVSMQQLYNYKVGLGYIEFKSIDAKSYKFTKADKNDNPRIFSVPLDGKPEATSKYTRSTIYEEVTYKSYYLVIGPIDQKLYKFGKLPYAYLEGSEDELSSFTICAYRDEGPSIVEVAKPHVNRMEKAVKKHDYLINKAKESGYMINIDSIVALAEQLSTDNKVVDPMTVLNTMNDSPNMLYSTNQSIGGNGIPIQELKNGIIEAAKDFRDIKNDCVIDIFSSIGISPLREGYAPQPRDVATLQQQSLVASHLSTSYISKMLTYVWSDAATRMLSYIQSIVKFKKINSRPFKYLVKLLDATIIADIESMEDTAAHRYGLFVLPFNRMYDKTEIKNLAITAYTQGQITLDQVLVLNNIDSPKKAGQMLAYMKRKQEQQAAKFEQMKAQLIEQGKQADHKRAVEIEEIRSKGNIEGKNVEGEWYYKAHVDAARERKEGTEMKIAADREKQTDKNLATLDQIDAKSRAGEEI